jgi:hypothetical protein
MRGSRAAQSAAADNYSASQLIRAQHSRATPMGVALPTQVIADLGLVHVRSFKKRR